MGVKEIRIAEHEFEDLLQELKMVTNNQSLTPKLNELREVIEEYLNGYEHL